MSATRPLGLTDSIFNRSLALVLAVVLLLTVVNIAIILFRGPLIEVPFTAYEIARVVQGKPIAKGREQLLMSEVSTPPISAALSGEKDLFAAAVAAFLHMPPKDVRIDREIVGPLGEQDFEEQMRRESRLYAKEGQFNPISLGSFTIAVRKADGRWTVASSSPSSDALKNWRLRTVLRFLISLLVILPVAWLFSSRLARPIGAFGQAAQRLGRRRQMELVEVKGPIEIRQAAAAINEMQERLQAHLEERSSMVGAIAHDLRTPLSRLNFHLAAAPENVRIKAEAEIAEMEDLIAAILDFVRNEGRPRTLDSVDLGLLVEGVVDDFSDLGHDVALVRNDKVTLLGDAALLKRLFANLISNAIAYGRSARVSLGLEDGNAVVEIEDDGPGLADDDLERVFTPFYRAESSRSRATGGMGLGLAIVKSVAETHGGGVQLFNRNEGGLCARVILPVE